MEVNGLVKRMKRWKVFLGGIILALCTVFFLFVDKKSVFGATDQEVIDVYKEVSSLFKVSSGWLFDDKMREFCWTLVSFLALRVREVEVMVYKILSFNDFFSHSSVTSLINQVKPFILGCFLLAVIFLGYRFITNKIEKREEIITNILLAVTIFLIVPIMMVQLSGVLKIGLGNLNPNSGVPTTLSDRVVKNNVADLVHYGNNNFNLSGASENYIGNVARGTLPKPYNPFYETGTGNLENGNLLPGYFTFNYVDPSARVKPDDFSGVSEKLFSNKVRSNGSGGYVLEEMRENLKVLRIDLGFGGESYYRFHIEWFNIIATLIVVGIAMAITVIKIGRNIFDLAFQKVYAMFTAVTDLSGGQRMKKVLTEIVSTFGVIYIMMFILQLFVLYANWVLEKQSTIGTFGTILLLIAGAWAVIDAPDIVEKTLGIDAGLKSGYAALMGAYAGSRMAGSAVQGVSKGMSGVARGTVIGKRVAQSGYEKAQVKSGHWQANGNNSGGGLGSGESGSGGKGSHSGGSGRNNKGYENSSGSGTGGNNTNSSSSGGSGTNGSSSSSSGSSEKNSGGSGGISGSHSGSESGGSGTSGNNSSLSSSGGSNRGGLSNSETGNGQGGKNNSSSGSGSSGNTSSTASQQTKATKGDTGKTGSKGDKANGGRNSVNDNQQNQDSNNIYRGNNEDPKNAYKSKPESPVIPITRKDSDVRKP